MTKIERHLNLHGKKLNYIGCRIEKHYGGRSFYNDGAYNVNIYEIEGTGCFIHHKSTGRPAFYLYEGNQLMSVRFTQREFCELLTCHFDFIPV